MNIDIVIKGVELINTVLQAYGASTESRDRIADAIRNNRPITDAELQESFDSAQDAINKARED